MEYRDLILSGNVTTCQVVDEDRKYFQSIFDELIDDSMPVAKKWKGIVLLKSEQRVDCDFLQLDEFGCFLIGSRAKELLEPFLTGHDIEYLPCKTEDGIFYFKLNFRSLRMTSCLCLRLINVIARAKPEAIQKPRTGLFRASPPQ